MAHFAKIDPDTNLVLTVNTVNNSDCVDSNGVDLGPDQSKAFRGNFAGIGYEWDSTNQIFWPEKPFPSWVKNISTAQWESPVGPKPSLTSEQTNSTTHDYIRQWNESTTSWDIIETPKQPALTSEQEAAGQYYDYNSDNNSWELQTP